ncbi:MULTISPECIES: acyl carrier protein [unclassified Pseudofrankia]|uniref:acyl carrier protein n=1 Tax=unclassified Pseudofrankia TaxID=2994372 RepID=UPI0008D9116A|nr:MULTISPECIES: acyl carrier protein [unclassified Pseudofrankia]MDT3439529.1 acyl carrier protein [Pseudofrankia sp. BMG5.37]OHV48713.1 phosphopantetheine-binding protein [Pseudofrankia sp. BMG5.36]
MTPSQAEIVQWCRAYLADLLEVSVESIDPDADFDRLGVDSALAVSLLIEVEERYGVDLPPEALFENPNLSAVAAYLYAHSPRQVAQP